MKALMNLKNAVLFIIIYMHLYTHIHENGVYIIQLYMHDWDFPKMKKRL